MGWPKFSKTGSMWPLQADFGQQCGHWWQIGQKAIDLHTHLKHLSNILFVLQWVLCLSFLAVWRQKVCD